MTLQIIINFIVLSSLVLTPVTMATLSVLYINPSWAGETLSNPIKIRIAQPDKQAEHWPQVLFVIRFSFLRFLLGLFTFWLLTEYTNGILRIIYSITTANPSLCLFFKVHREKINKARYFTGSQGSYDTVIFEQGKSLNFSIASAINDSRSRISSSNNSSEIRNRSTETFFGSRPISTVNLFFS